MTLGINSRLRLGKERRDPKGLAPNAVLSFQGSMVTGQGFTLTPEERDALIEKNSKNAERIYPYIGGEEVNTSPTQLFHRYVINFGSMSLGEAGRWPDLLEIVRDRVKPDRDRLPPKNGWNRDVRARWWQFAALRVGLHAAIEDLPRCLVTARVSKHLCFSFQPTDRVFTNMLYVYPLPAYTYFAVLQSRVHKPWVRLLSSTLGKAPRYAASDCFDTFPFPGDPMTPDDIKNMRIPELETIGKVLYETRARIMVARQIGLTKLYNALKAPGPTDAEIEALRAMHVEMDAAVLRAYGWDDLAARVPPYNTKDAAWEEQIIDRLWDLNESRNKL